ncbi:MAG: hypothetical protein IJP55_08970, partial [Bacteroidales bacterium]|nr:hypothetical protein [Bacteroidales bacterium]
PVLDAGYNGVQGDTLAGTKTSVFVPIFTPRPRHKSGLVSCLFLSTLQGLIFIFTKFDHILTTFFQ